MGLNLSKGQSAGLNLSKNGGNVFYVGLGWPHIKVAGKDIDLDVTAIVCDAGGVALNEQHVLFYNQTVVNGADGKPSLTHGGDNRTGAGAGDDESIIINLDNIDPRAAQIAVVVTMHEAPASTTFKDLGTAEPTFIRVCNTDGNGNEILRYTLGDVAADANCLQFGALMKDANGGWNFQAIGAGGVADLSGVLKQYGIG